jgi:hypothetical protein
MTHKMIAIGGLSRPLADGEKWYLKVAHGTVRMFQAVEHLMKRFLEVEPIYPCRH